MLVPGLSGSRGLDSLRVTHCPRPCDDLPRDASLRIAQRISCTLHRENARAILRHSPGSIHGPFPLSCRCVSSRPPFPPSLFVSAVSSVFFLFVAPSLALVRLFVFGSAVGFCCDVFAPFLPGLGTLVLWPLLCLTLGLSAIFFFFWVVFGPSPWLRRHWPQGSAFCVFLSSVSHGWSVGLV